MALELVTAPSEEPVSLAEAKLHLRVDGAEDDALITRSIAAARRWCEEQCGRAFVTQTLRLWLRRFPCVCADNPEAEIEIPRPRLRSVDSVKYIDTAGVLQTLGAGQYTVDSVLEPGRIVPAYGCSWPATRDVINAVQVQYQAGWGDAASVDERAKQAVLFLVGHWYEHREGVLVGTISKEIELATRSLLGQLWHGRLP